MPNPNKIYYVVDRREYVGRYGMTFYEPDLPEGTEWAGYVSEPPESAEKSCLVVVLTPLAPNDQRWNSYTRDQAVRYCERKGIDPANMDKWLGGDGVTV